MALNKKSNPSSKNDLARLWRLFDEGLRYLRIKRYIIYPIGLS